MKVTDRNVFLHWVCHPIFPQECLTILIGASSNKRSELAFVHLFDLQICFVGVFPTHQDLDDNVNSLVFYIEFP